MSDPDLSETAAWLNIYGDPPCLLPDDDTAVERLADADHRTDCSLAHLHPPHHLHRDRAARMVAALREGEQRK